MFGKNGHIQYSDRIVVIIRTCFSGQTIPLTAQIHTELVQFCRMINLGTHFLYFEMSVQFLEQLSFGQTIQIFHYPVVIDNLQLMVGEMYGHKEVVLFFTGMIRILCCIFGTDTGSCSCTVVSVGHIGVRHFRCEQLFQPFIGFRTVDRPKMVSEPVFCHKIVVCFLILHNIFNDSVNFRHGTIGKKYRFQVSIHITGQHHPVLFFIGTGEFMFFNHPVHIILTGSTTDNTVLGTAFHGLSINIKFRFRILYQPSLVLKHFEIFDTLIVNFFRVDIRSGRAIDFGPGNMQQ